MKNKKCIGSWELKKWTAELNDGTEIFPFGEDAIGRVTYKKSSEMSVHVMKNNRLKFLSEDPLQAKPEEMIIAFQDFLSYCGSYEVHNMSNQMLHKIKSALSPTGLVKIKSENSNLGMTY